jgi:hypothetical protein
MREESEMWGGFISLYFFVDESLGRRLAIDLSDIRWVICSFKSCLFENLEVVMIRTRAAAIVLGLAGMFCASARGYTFISFDGPPDATGGTTANGINSLGEITGFSSNTGATQLTNFIRKTDGTFTVLTKVNTSSALAMANGINSSDSVVGSTMINAFLYSGGNLTILPNATSTTTSEAAFGINDSGVVVGQYADSLTGTTPGFVDIGGTFTTLNPTAQAKVTNAQGVNNHGVVAGFYADNTNATAQHGFLYDTTSKTFTLIADPTPTLEAGQSLVLSQVLGINDNGLASGYYQTTNGSQHGYIYNTVTKTYTFLDEPNAPTSGVSITQITGINDAGDLTGFYVDSGGVQHGFLATPSTVVPLPGAAWSSVAMLAGLGLVMGLKKRYAV